MQDLKVYALQVDQIWEDKAANFALYNQMLQTIEDAQLIILPEMFQTGFSMNTSLAEDFDKSESINWLTAKAKEKNSAIYTSMMIREGKRCTNRGMFVYPDGSIRYYDKRKTFTLAKEHNYFDAGKETVIVDYLGWKIQLQICYDLRFPEIMRNTWSDTNASCRYDVLLVVANWPAKRIEHWKTLLKARAIENQSYVLGVNRVGTDQAGLEYSGDSLFVNALGEVMVSNSNEQIPLYAVLSMDELQKIRKQLPFLKDQNLK